MSLDPDFLHLLACPATRKPLVELPDGDLQALNARIARGGVRTRGGTERTEPVRAALQPEGERYVYPIQDEIPILLTTEAIPLDDGAEATSPRSRDADGVA